jgi:hypothetical protein
MTMKKLDTDIVLELAPFGGVRPPCQAEYRRPLSLKAFRVIEAWARRKFEAGDAVQIVEWVSRDSRRTPHRVELTWNDGENTWGTLLFESTEQLLARVQREAATRTTSGDEPKRALATPIA